MVEITGEIIKSAVAAKILESIPSAAGSVYKEGQYQGKAGDAFYIVQRRVSQQWQIKQLLKRDYEMIVRYEPDINSQKKLENCSQMGNILMFALKSIDSGDGVLVHGTNMNFETVDGVALVYVTYSIRIKDVPNTLNPMKDLEINKEVY